MSQNFDAGKLARMAEQLLEGREFFLNTVRERVREASNRFPHDGAIRTMQSVLEKRAEKGNSLATISQREFQDLYNDVNSLGSHEVFREALGDLLLERAPAATAHYNDEFARSVRGGDTEIDLVDPNLAESLAGLFDAPSKIAQGSFVDNGRKGVELELKSLGFDNPSVEIAARNDKFVIYSAAIDSTHGRFAALIPAEIKLGSVLMPTAFVSGNQFLELNAKNLYAHAQMVATTGKQAQAGKVLETLTAAVDQSEVRKSAGVDDDFNAALSVPELYRSEDESRYYPAELDLSVQAETPQELTHFTEGMLRDVLAEAGLSFAPELVTQAKSIVAGELKACGVPCSKVSIASEFDGGLVVAANLTGPGGTKTIEVPVEIVNNRPLMPSVFTSGAFAKPFDEDNLKSFAMNRDEGTFSAIMSDKYGMSFKELHNHTLKSAGYGNFVEVEEGLAVIADRFGDQFHKIAFDDLMGLLNVGFGEEEKPIDAVDKYMKEAMDKARDHEANIKMSSNLMYLHPED